MYIYVKPLHPARAANLPIAYIQKQGARQRALVAAGASRMLAARLTGVSSRTVWTRTVREGRGYTPSDLDLKHARDTLYLLSLDGCVKDIASRPYRHE